MDFCELALTPELQEAVSKLGFTTPTAVQAAVIPVILNRSRDLVALAQTGTGKTAAFGLPLLQLLDPQIKAPQALILCPTRELCMQITRDLQSFASCCRAVSIVAIYGGADIRTQLIALQRGVEIIVATPGRMLDMLRRQAVDFTRIQRVVLDEADEMLNMGFEEEMEAILGSLPEGVQTLLFSATMPRQVASIAKRYMRDPEEITVGTRNSGAENVSHEYLVVHAKDRYRALKRLADFYPDMYSIVFCRTRQDTQFIADHLGSDGYNVEALHGDLTQQQRDRVMAKFRGRELQMLIATDVAARGLDVTELTHVINYCLPDDLSSYTHRSGRTGRAGKTGVSIVLINMREHHKIKCLEKQLGCKFVQRAVPTGADICQSRLLDLLNRLSQVKPEPGLLDEILPGLCESLIGVSREELLRRFATLELHRMFEYYGKEPDLNVEKIADSGQRGERGDRGERKTSAAAMVELMMNIGKVNQLTPKLLMGLINTADRNRNVEIGRINVSRMQTYFEVPGNEAEAVIRSFTRGNLEFDGRRVGVSYATQRDAGSSNNGPREKARHRKGPKRGSFAGAN